MEIRHFRSIHFRILTALVLLVLAGTLVSAPKSPFTPKDKAFYLSERDISYIRPGLVVKVLSASIAADGTVTARIRFADPKDVPLDRAGITTPGPIGASVLIAYIPKGETQYVAYTTRTQTSPITGVSAVQAGTDSGGVWTQVADGEYTYRFATKLPANYDKTVTHTVGVYANRNLTEFDLGIALDDTAYHFVPDGSSQPAPRDVVKTATCQKCHVDYFAFHGTGGRSSMETCVLCHTPQTVDPDTGNTLDMVTMTHKIHMGADLPSVLAGGQYMIIGNRQAEHDYSEVGFPTDQRNCTVCHEEGKGAKQEKNFLSRPTRAGCGSCHDNVDFAAGTGHLPMNDDKNCATCHPADSGKEYDLSIAGAHTVPFKSKQLTGIDWKILDVSDAAPGKKPVLQFSIADKTGKPLTPKDFGRLTAVLAGPTSDYTMKFGTATTSGYVSEDMLVNATGSNGTYTYTFTNAIPANAKGSFSISLEGRRVEIIKGPGNKDLSVQYGTKNAVSYFTVDGTPVVPRRTVVTIEKCQSCHDSIRLHGENRVDAIEHCVVCHNPVETDVSRRPAAEAPSQSVDFRQMIHNIHGGHEIQSNFGTENYVIYGYGGSLNNFSHIRYPGRLSNCDSCHVNNSHMPLTTAETRANVSNPRGWRTNAGPTAAACLSCHKSVAAASHTMANTSSLGESCGACHGSNGDFSVQKVHATPSTPVVR
ncbi:MAG: OmcA/MtrC family decaheme c-type cytochrome [Acidobacteria bacterium]|nr:OmcA/MtrC family decaheme c-type cytochrome [Acidobacteriota bacterium]